MERPYKRMLETATAAAAVVAAAICFVEENASAGVIGAVAAAFMILSILASIFEDKELKAWMKKADEDRARFEHVMASFGYDLHRLKATAEFSPADFDGPQPTLLVYAGTQTVDPPRLRRRVVPRRV